MIKTESITDIAGQQLWDTISYTRSSRTREVCFPTDEEIPLNPTQSSLPLSLLLTLFHPITLKAHLHIPLNIPTGEASACCDQLGATYMLTASPLMQVSACQLKHYFKDVLICTSPALLSLQYIRNLLELLYKIPTSLPKHGWILHWRF